MWTIRGSTVSDATEPNASVNILNFRASQYVSEADFNNLSNQFGIVYARTSSISDYTATGSHSGNLLAYNRFNILHPSTSGSWEYDGCYYTWLYETVGSDDYKFKAYRLNNLTYNYSVTVTARLTQGDLQLTVPKSRIKSAYLIATSNENTSSGIGVCRVLWHADMSFNGNFSQYPDQWWLGPAIPQSTIEEWLKKNKEDDPDEPDKPDPNPDDADQSSATTADWTWLNKFKIMNWPDTAPWPSKFLIEGGVMQSVEDFMAFNHNNDPDSNYHLTGQYIGHSAAWTSFINASNNCAKNINDNIAVFGSSLTVMDDMGSSTGNFISNVSTIDGPYTNRKMIGSISNSGTTITLENMQIFVPYTLTTADLQYIKIITGNSTFCIHDNYSNFNGTLYSDMYRASRFNIYSGMIIRYKGHYYLGGYFWQETNPDVTAASGFGIVCRIDDLKSLNGNDPDAPGDYGGTEPEDPTPTSDPDNDDGANPDNLDDTFGDGTGKSPDPTTDKEVDKNIGNGESDGSSNNGSSKDKDGKDKDPRDTIGTNPGPGEKMSYPVNSNTIPNTHDGSMGNGTGDPHEGDDTITDPSTTMPTTAGDEGTVSGSGVLSVFTPTQAELTAFTSELLSSSVMDSIKNFFTTNPMDGIFALHILPYTGFAGVATASPRIGTHTFTATMTMAANEFITVDYGYVDVPFVYDGYENYAPNSDVKIFLPFIGTKDIDINVIQGCRCTLKYNVSLRTGDIYAYMYCQWISRWGDFGTEKGIDHLVYSWQGNCAATVPLSHLDSTNYISGAMQIAGGISSLAAGAASANPFAIPSGIAGVTQGVAEMGRTSIITSGNISGMAAFMGCREPFFIFSRPIIAFNSYYNHYLGQRSNAIETIGSLRDGTFTMMRNVDLTGVSATSAELSEIEAILKGGFYI